jgi:hypothetical protein
VDQDPPCFSGKLAAAAQSGALQGPARNVGAHAFPTDIGIAGTYVSFELGIQFTGKIHDLLLHKFLLIILVALVGAHLSYHSKRYTTAQQFKPNVN